MKIHKVKSPFMCYAGQFVAGERHLCIGIKTDVLRSKPEHLVQLNTKVYKIDCKKAMALALEKNSFFKGNNVAIVPIMLVGEEVATAPQTHIELVESVLEPEKPIAPETSKLFDMEPVNRSKGQRGWLYAD
jgi:hypothetical protein